MTRKKTMDQVTSQPPGSFAEFLNAQSDLKRALDLDRPMRHGDGEVCFPRVGGLRIAFIGGEWVPCPVCQKGGK